MNLLIIAARISATNVESIRHKDRENKFDLTKFKNLSSYEALKYANDRLQRIGAGSSRAVYVLNSSKVLKIAIIHRWELDAGIAQNKAEVDFYTNPKTKQVCAKVFDFDPNYIWLISELVRPVSKKEFEKLTGVEPIDFEYFGKCLEDGMTPEETYEQHLEDSEIQDVKPVSREKFDGWIHILKNIIDQGVVVGDLTNHEHWGITSSGNLVVLDYGLTKGVYRAHYSSPIFIQRISKIPREMVEFSFSNELTNSSSSISPPHEFI